MSTLALDLGTKTGWALHAAGTTTSGTWKLDNEGADRDDEPRFIQLWRKLESVFHGCARSGDVLSDIWFEDVEFQTYLKQAQLWAGFRATTMVFAKLCSPSLLTHAIPVGTLKLFATGHGGAKKTHMALALKKLGLWGSGMDDNCVDAYHLLRLALTKKKR